MKLITWNCQGGFRKKADTVLTQKPDILIIQECECSDKLMFPETTIKPTQFLRIGDNLHKGVAVLSYSNYKFEILPEYNPDFKTIVPVSVTGGDVEFILFAICANNPQDKNNQYIEQVWKAINYYDSLLKFENIILAGDFNSNKIWDKKHRIGNHSDVVKKLEENAIVSVYHAFLNQQQGEENDPTFFLYRHENKPYHIDYCFTSETLYKKVKNIEVGLAENWLKYSDHMPITIDFEI